MEFHKINGRLYNTTKALKKWNIKAFNFTYDKIKQIEEQLEQLRISNFDENRQLQLKEQLKTRRRKHESIYHQKSHEVWLKDGDHNTTFFHMSTFFRRRNIIQAIKEGNNQIFEEKDIGEYFLKNFKELYTSSFPSLDEGLDNIGTFYITDVGNLEINCIPKEKETKEVVWKLHQLKSSGLHGFFVIFYKRYWKLLKRKIVGQKCFKLGRSL